MNVDLGKDGASMNGNKAIERLKKKAVNKISGAIIDCVFTVGIAALIGGTWLVTTRYVWLTW